MTAFGSSSHAPLIGALLMLVSLAEQPRRALAQDGMAPTDAPSGPAAPPEPDVIPALPGEAITPPELLSDPDVATPDGARGPAEVVLELVVSNTPPRPRRVTPGALAE